MSPALPAMPLDQPVLIAGATASGKSALALSIAQSQGREIVNADALQVFDAWPILTARPSSDDLALAIHHLYGHVPEDASYSVGQWLRDVEPHLQINPAPVIVGGTGLYFMAMTEGLADIPPTDPEIRAEADAKLANEGIAALLSDLDRESAERLDAQNPVRVQRAWEVQRQTGRGIADWQDRTGPPRIPTTACVPIHLTADPAWLAQRIDTRFDQMLDAGALDEARAMNQRWNAALQSSRAIGAAELIAAVRGDQSMSEAIAQAKQATRQYAKKQRTWFRRRMREWHVVAAEPLALGKTSL